MKKQILILLSMFLCLTISFSQSKNTQKIPSFLFQFKSGASIPLLDLAGNWPSDMSNNPIPFFMKTPGFNFGITSKLYPAKSNFGITANISVYLFKTSNLKDTVFPTGQRLFNSYSLNLLSGAVGFEYRFLSKSVIPFIGLEFSTNYLWGDANSNGNSLTMKSTERYGINSNAGIDFKINKKFGVVIGGIFSIFNIAGRKTNEYSTSGDYSIVDAPDGGSKGRTMASINLYIGLTYYSHYVKVKK